MVKRFFLFIPFLAFWTAASPLFSGEILINSGHHAQVNHLDYLQGDLFSLSRDGTLKVWEASGRLRASRPIAGGDIRMAALSPARNEAAVISADSTGACRLSAYNWQTGEELFSLPLPEQPLFLRYSPRGSFLVWGITGWNSLQFVDAETGRTLNFLEEGFGIVSGAFISSTEKTILTYGPSGSLQYWDLELGTLKTRFSTFPGLALLGWTASGRYLAAADRDTLYLIDLLTGQAVDRRSFSGILDLSVDSQGGLAVLSRGNFGPVLTNFDLSGNSLRLLREEPELGLERLDRLCGGGGGVFLTGGDGLIYRYDLNRRALSLFARPELASLSDVSADREGLLLAVNPGAGRTGSLLTLDAAFFEAAARYGAFLRAQRPAPVSEPVPPPPGSPPESDRETPWVSPLLARPPGTFYDIPSLLRRSGRPFSGRPFSAETPEPPAAETSLPPAEAPAPEPSAPPLVPEPSVAPPPAEPVVRPPGVDLPGAPSLTAIPAPFPGSLRISRYGEDRFLLWSAEAGGELVLMGPGSRMRRIPAGPSAGYLDISIEGGRLATLDRSGLCRVIDPETGEVVFQFTSSGLQHISWTAEGSLLAGRTRSASFSTPLLHINIRTGETVNLEDSNLWVSRLALDSRSQTIYSLGIQESPEGLQTVLKTHRGRGLSRTDVLYSFPGEFLSPPFYLQKEDSRLFFYLSGTGGIKMLQFGDLEDFESAASPPRSLMTLGSFVLSLNEDASVSFWRIGERDLLFTFCLFRDESWALIYPEGNYLASPGGEKYIRVIEP
ncbi:MAG: WD40 repeat domain-containing protein [Spirochaetales bacterium]|jgi:hypothetical protein|nr:WD40 repeat domain-containing protein [Spirochaetales bacterium]